MIVEILDHGFNRALFNTDDKEKQHLYGLSTLFNKLSLPLPNISEVQRTHEKGFNLFLNHYGCVLRLYPRNRDITKPSTYNTYGQIYHHRSLPPLGVVRFPNFNMQIMPGLMPYNSRIHTHEKIVQKDFKRTVGTNHDSGARNLGYQSPNHQSPKDLMLLDTVFVRYHKSTRDTEYLGKYADKIIERSEFVSDLQEAFYKGWVSNKPKEMERFWQKCRHAHLGGDRLYTGWLDEDNTILQTTNRVKGDFVQMSLDYDARLQRHLKR